MPGVIKILKSGGIGILPTDTLYGLVGSAFSKKAVARIYKLRRRNPKKPMIVLVGSLADIQKFGVKIDKRTKNFLRKIWPGKISVILPCPLKQSVYLHRGANSLAFRLPAKKSLRRLLEKTGPLVAPSVNPEGRPPAKTIKEAKKYFGQVDFYVDAGKLNNQPSLLVLIKR